MHDEILCPRSDVIFKLLFGDERSVEILTAFLQAVLKLPAEEYEEVELVNPHLKPEQLDDKLGILDVRVRTKSGKDIDIELQVRPSPELCERVIFYGAKMITEQIKAGEPYSGIKRAIQIIITDHVLIRGSARYHHRFRYSDLEAGVELTDIREINILELPKLPVHEDGTQLWDWMKFLDARRKEDLEMIAQKNPQVNRAVMRLAELSADEQTRLLYESRQKMEWDNQARERGARDEGRMEGRNEERYAIAKNLLTMAVPFDKVAAATGLTLEEVEGLRG